MRNGGKLGPFKCVLAAILANGRFQLPDRKSPKTGAHIFRECGGIPCTIAHEKYSSYSVFLGH